MKAEAGGRIYDLTDRDQAREFLTAQWADLEREYQTPAWERLLLVVVLIALLLVVVSAVVSVAVTP